MLTKCINPSCSARFLRLNHGKLFRLEDDSVVRRDQSSGVEYFWLCDGCSSIMTLHLGEDGRVVVVPISKNSGRIMDVISLTSKDGKRRLLLRKVCFGDRAA